MKMLHTSDWHVGKAIRGQSRAEEHRQVLNEIIDIANREAVDLIIVAGDLFETSSPSPEAESIVYDAFLRMSAIAPVVAISGNHDNPRRLGAVAPLLQLGQVTLVTEPKSPANGGVIDVVVKNSDGAPVTVRVALLPFVSQRSIVKADELMAEAAFQNAQRYADRMHRVVGALSATFTSETINVIVGHAFVQGGVSGGGERAAHLVEEYSVPTTAFPASATYVALGHLHRAQVVRGATSIHYCGSPLQLDFGEEAQTKQVNVIEAYPGLPAKVSAIPLTTGRQLRTLIGSLPDLAGLVGSATISDVGNGLPWLRVRLQEQPRPGLADEVRQLLGPGVVDVVIEHDKVASPKRVRRDGRSPLELFGDYLEERGVKDDRLHAGFAELLETVDMGGETT